MKVLFAMVLLMIAATYACSTGDTAVLEQVVTDVVEAVDVDVAAEDTGTDTEVMPSDVPVSLDANDTVAIVDVEN